jgi:hypothetical protein
MRGFVRIGLVGKYLKMVNYFFYSIKFFIIHFFYLFLAKNKEKRLCRSHPGVFDFGHTGKNVTESI